MFTLSLFLSLTNAFGGVDRVLDPHVHVFANWAAINYTYDKGSIFDHNWTYDDYIKATHPSALPSTEFIFMSLLGVPKDQYLLQVQLANDEAKRLKRLGVQPQMVGIMADGDLSDDSSVFNHFLDELHTTTPLLVGLRPRPIPWDNHTVLISNLRNMERRGLVFDIQLADLTEVEKLIAVAKLLPSLKVVVNHFGFSKVPGVAPDFATWKPYLTQLSGQPNVFIKVSGGQAASGDPRAVMKPYVEHTIYSFGYQRCIYDGNWFVVNAQDGFYSYRSWAQAVVEYVEEFNATDADQDWLFYSTGAKVYDVANSGRNLVV